MRGYSYLRGNRCSRHSSGFTLVELIISIVLIGILAAVGSSMIVDSFTTTRMVNADNASAGQARYALERLVREIREIKHVSGVATCSDGTTTNSYCITTMTPTPPNTNSILVFTRTVSGADVAVTIDTSGADLRLGYSPGVTSTLCSQLDLNNHGFELLYYKNDGTTPATSGSDIAFVQITLTVKDLTSGQSISRRTRVALRNA